MEDKNKSLTYKIHENSNKVNRREKIESNNLAPTVDYADKESKISTVSSCEQTRSKPLSSTSPTVYNAETRINSEDQNILDNEGTASVGSRGLDKVVSSDNKSDVETFYDGIKKVQGNDLVGGLAPKDSGTANNTKTVHQYSKTTLRSKKKGKRKSN